MYIAIYNGTIPECLYTYLLHFYMLYIYKDIYMNLYIHQFEFLTGKYLGISKVGEYWDFKRTISYMSGCTLENSNPISLYLL